MGEAADGAEAVALVERALEPDVVLMDVRMPDVDGIEATRQIVASGSPARIIILTTHDLDEYVFAALRAGASGFLLKDVRPPELVEGIRVVARGRRPAGGERDPSPARPLRRTSCRTTRRPPADLEELTGPGASRCCAWWRWPCRTPRSPRAWC